LLAYRELDDVLGLTEMAGDVLADARSGKNGRHALAGLFRQSVFGRLAGYEDVNDAGRLRHDPAMRWIVVKVMEHAAARAAAPTIAMVEDSLMYQSFFSKASRPRKSMQVALPRGRRWRHCANLDSQLDAQKGCSWPSFGSGGFFFVSPLAAANLRGLYALG
jgi:DDE family transposase